VRLHEKGGKEHEIPCHHNLETYLDEYIAAASITHDPDGPLFRTAAGKTGELTCNPMWQQDAYRMIQRRGRRRHQDQDRQSHFPRDRHYHLPQEQRYTRTCAVSR
jgi:hypothetical protein